MKGAWPCANVTARVPEIIRGLSHPLARRSAVALLHVLEEIENEKYKMRIKIHFIQLFNTRIFFKVEKIAPEAVPICPAAYELSLPVKMSK